MKRVWLALSIVLGAIALSIWLVHTQRAAVVKTALDLWQSDEVAAAELAFQRVLESDNDDPLANYYYAQCLLRRGDTEGAERPLQRAAVGDTELSFKAQAQLRELVAKRESMPQEFQECPDCPVMVKSTVNDRSDNTKS